MTILPSAPRFATVGLALGTAGLLAACAEPAPVNSAASPATSAAATSAAGAPSTSAAGVPSTTPATTTSAAPATEGPTPGVEPVNCGKVGPDGGEQVDLIAESTAAGRVGCTEAINVISAYYRDAPTKAEGTAHHLVVQGWNCLADTGAYGTGSIGCDKDGFAFHTEP